MKTACFVTGTDTEIGKTRIAAALIHALRQTGRSTVGMKPVAAGCDAAGRNDDVERLVAASSFAAPRELVTPYLFDAAVAPHIAAAESGVVIDVATIVAAFDALSALADAVVVEGVGGFRVPLGERADTADLATALGLPVILVVGMRLGCISHALLTADAIAARGLTLAGWVANRVDPRMARFDENVAALCARLPAPLIGVVPWNPEETAAETGRRLTLPPLTGR